MKTYHIITYGCQANVADAERIAGRLEKQGYKKTEQIEKANLVVINACSVRQSAINRVYGKLNKLNGKKIILAGCILESDKKKMKDKIWKFWNPNEYFSCSPIYSDKKTAFIPIMTGCNNFCSYCVVPYTRGREQSRPTQEIIDEVKNLINKNYKDIWLIGQNVNSYPDFHNLLKKIDNLSGDFTIHFMTSHPKDMSDKLIKTIKESEKVSKEIHLPVQSGDNKILKAMNRNYTVEHYKKLIKKILKEIPEAKISTDIIVGFPNETKKQFQNTVKLFKEIRFEKAYISKYSPRPGTLAAKLKDNIPLEEKKRRWRILNDLVHPVRNNISNGAGKLIVIIGPTASGKTALSLELAKKFNGEIISADSRQIYKEMDIGTAKPTKKELTSIKHYLINIKKTRENYSVGEFKKDALNAINKIIKKGKTPILVGGTGLYVSVVVNNWEIPQIKENKKIRAEIEKEIKEKGLDFVFKKLVKLDPEAAYIIDPKNPRRVIRALEIALVSGRKFSEQRKAGNPLYDILEIGLNPPSEILKPRINARIKEMVNDGLIDEVKKLVKKYGYKCKAFDAIDYREIIDYLKKKTTIEQTITQIQNNTWHYAKRQMTWFKKYNPKTHWVNPPAGGYKEAERLVKKFLER
jgi:tRNA-2-methylthio-N6-dimethylallyladenosine synthase